MAIDPRSSDLPRDRHIFGTGRKRILSLDGGGVRGILTLALLERVEAILARRSGRGADFRLCQYFDLMGGTSVGAILATALAVGFPVGKVIALLREVVRDVFHSSFMSLGGLLTPKFSSTALEAILKRELGEATLGSDRVLTGLAVVMKRLDTGSVWILHNNPLGKYYEPRDGEQAFTPNKDLLLRLIVQASAAAPSYFEPQLMTVAADIKGFFLDGGVSPYNNPALLLVLLATAQGFRFGWKAGDDNMLMVSVGTGMTPVVRSAEELHGRTTALMAVDSLKSLIDDSVVHTQAMLQWMGASTNPQIIDSEVGDLSDSWPLKERLLTYTRLDLPLDRRSLSAGYGINMTDVMVERLRLMDEPSGVDTLLDLGRRTAERIVTEDVLPAKFDI
jgi:predicted acylesterase/phospholipase RssA